MSLHPARGLILLLLLLSSSAYAQVITNISVSYSPSSPRVGEPYTATATVTASGPATPTGTVQIFFSGNPESCTTGPLTGTGLSTTANCTLISSTAGTKALQAFYIPGNYGTAPGANVPVTIQPAATTLELKARPDPSARNRVHVQAVVLPSVGTPTGSFTFSSGSNNCTAATGDNWCSLLPDQSSTSPSISVVYSGDANFNPANASTTLSVVDLPWVRRILSAPLPSQATDPYTNAPVADGFDGGSWSDDGRYFVFASLSRLSPADTNVSSDIYLWDDRDQTLKLLSFGPDIATASNGDSYRPRLSGSGRFVVFESFASNLVAGDTNGVADIFRQDLLTGSRVRVTPNVMSASAYGADISSTGRYVSFASAAGNLVAGDTNGLADAFRADLDLGTLIRVSVSGSNTEGVGPPGITGVTETAISGDGQIVAFLSNFTNGDFLAGASTTSFARPFARSLANSTTTYLSQGTATLPAIELSMSKDSFPTVIWTTAQSLLTPDNNGQFDIYGRALPSGPLQLISATASSVVGNEASSGGRISANGQIVVFESFATNFAPGVANGSSEIFGKALGSGALRRINAIDGTVGTQSTQAFQSARGASPNADASKVSFASAAPDLAPSSAVQGSPIYFLRIDAAQRTRAIARTPIGGQANADSFEASLSPNAAWLAYSTAASNLIAGLVDRNGRADVYLRPALAVTGTPVLISRTSGGQSGNGLSARPAISASATPRVAFESDASDLVAGDTNGLSDIFIAGATGAVSRLSVSSAGVQANGSSFGPDISNDGDRVVFHSSASNLVAGTTGEQVFLRQVSAGTTTLVSRATGAGGAIANGNSSPARISADGRVAVFVSNASNLVSGVSLNASTNVYLRELDAPFTTRIISANAAGTATGNGSSFVAAVDGTGSRVAFVTSASDLLPGDTNGWDDIYVRDVATGSLTRASLAPGNAQFAAPARSPALSADGRYVGFLVDFANAAERGYFNEVQAFVRDLQTGVTVRVDQTAEFGVANGNSLQLSMAGNGAYLSLISLADNLVPGDLNRQADAFLLRNPLAPLPTTLQITSNGPTVTGQPIVATVRLQGEFGVEPRPRGNVTVTGSGGESCTISDIAALNANVSEGSCTLGGPLPAGARTLAASYTPTGTLPDRYAAATGSVAHTVSPGASSLSTGFAPGTPVSGQSVSFSASVVAAAPAAGTPTGTVTVSVGGGLSGNCTITLPASNCSISFANAGSGSVTFNYSGDANFLGTVSSTPITVARANTTLSGGFSPSNPVVGASVTFTANLGVVAPGVGSPTGSIFVSAGGGLAGDCTISLPATSCAITFNTAASGTVSFGYPGDASFNPSSSGPLPITIGPVNVPTTTTITQINPNPVTVGSAYTISVSVGASPSSPTSGTVNVAASGFPDSCTITLPATSCTIPAAQTVLPGLRNLVASYSGSSGFDPSTSSPSVQVVATNSTTLSSPTLNPAGVVVGQPFSATGTLSNPVAASPLTPTGNLSARVLPLGNQVNCSLTPQSPGVAAYSCVGLISPIAAAKVVELRYAGSDDGVFPAAIATATQGVTRAPTETRILADTPDPSAPGQSVAVTVEVRALAPSTAAGPGIGTVTVSDGVDSCSYTLPGTGCSLSLSTAGLRTLTASYAGDANFLASSGTEPHTVTGGVAELSVSKQNQLRVLPAGADVSWLIELRNAGPSGTSALLQDPVPDGLSNFRWTCAASTGAQCSSSSGTGPLLETVILPAGGVVSYLLTARVDASPERLVEQRATVQAPSGVSDPNPANNIAVDADPIGVFGAGFEAAEGIPVEQPESLRQGPR